MDPASARKKVDSWRPTPAAPASPAPRVSLFLEPEARRLEFLNSLNLPALTEAARSAAAAAPAAAAAAAPRAGQSLDAGLQLLPRTAFLYRAPWAELLLSADALLFGFLAPRLRGFARLRETNIQLVRVPAAGGAGAGGEAHTLFAPLLDPVPASSVAFDGMRYKWALNQRRLLLIALMLLGINVGAWVISFTSLGVGALANPLQPVWRWQMVAVSDFVASVTAGDRIALQFAGWASLFGLIACVALWIVSDGKRRYVTHFMLGAGALPTVLPLVLSRAAPLVMVSYPWRGTHGAKDVARSLAASAPNCWIDVQMLASGTSVAAVTGAVSRWAYALVVVMSDVYLESQACLLEFSTALLRRQWYQRTIIYVPDGSVSRPENLELLERLEAVGVDIVRTPEDLVAFLNRHVYHCEEEDLQRCIAWHQETARPVSNVVDSGVRLPSPVIKARQWPVFVSPLHRVLAPSNAIRAGSLFLSADGLELGHCWALTAEQVLLAVVPITIIVGAACMAAANAESPLSIGTLVGLPIVFVIIQVLLLASALPSAVDLDARNMHSPLLLPLCVAAYCSSVFEQHQRSRRRHAPSFVKQLLSKSTSWAAAHAAARHESAPAHAAAPLQHTADHGTSLARVNVHEHAHHEHLPRIRASHLGSLNFRVFFVVSSPFVAGDGRTCTDDEANTCTDIGKRVDNMVTFLNELGVYSEVIGEDSVLAAAVSSAAPATPTTTPTTPTTPVTPASPAALTSPAAAGGGSGSGGGGARAAATSLFVFILQSREGALRWVSQWRGAVPPSRSVLCFDWRLVDHDHDKLFAAGGVLRPVLEHMVITLGACNGVSAMTAYRNDGLATAVLDALGSKVGAALLGT